MPELKEAILATGSMGLTYAGWLIAQAAVDPVAIAPTLPSLLSSVGGLGLAVWLVYYHTTVVMPNMQKLHAEERMQMQVQFNKTLDEKRVDYFREIHEQRQQFAEIIEKVSCKARPQ